MAEQRARSSDDTRRFEMQSQTSQTAVERFLLLQSPVQSVLCLVSLNVLDDEVTPQAAHRFHLCCVVADMADMADASCMWITAN